MDSDEALVGMKAKWEERRLKSNGQ
jgi:hypothetical protein